MRWHQVILLMSFSSQTSVCWVRHLVLLLVVDNLLELVLHLLRGNLLVLRYHRVRRRATLDVLEHYVLLLDGLWEGATFAHYALVHDVVQTSLPIVLMLALVGITVLIINLIIFMVWLLRMLECFHRLLLSTNFGHFPWRDSVWTFDVLVNLDWWNHWVDCAHLHLWMDINIHRPLVFENLVVLTSSHHWSSRNVVEATLMTSSYTSTSNVMMQLGLVLSIYLDREALVLGRVVAKRGDCV